jgi:hypothetical protein
VKAEKVKTMTKTAPTVAKAPAALKNPENVREFLRAQAGRFVTVEFIKKDGTIRKMNMQPATIAKRLVPADEVSESAKRGAETRRVLHPNLIPVWDVKNAWKMKHEEKKTGAEYDMATMRTACARSVNTDSIRAIVAQGVRMEFV